MANLPLQQIQQRVLKSQSLGIKNNGGTIFITLEGYEFNGVPHYIDTWHPTANNKKHRIMMFTS